MKKKLLLAVTTMLMIALVACGKEKTEMYEMETDTGKVTVEVKEDGDISITEEIDEAPEFVYEEGTIPLGTYVRSGGSVKLVFSENEQIENYCKIGDYSGQYEYDLETKTYTLKSIVPNYILTAYIDEQDNYNLIITNWYVSKIKGYAKDIEHYEDFIDIDNDVYDKTHSRLDIQEVYIRQ